MSVAAKLHRMLEQYVVPKEHRRNGEKHLGKVFRDLNELPLSSDLNADICEALDESENLIVVCTPETPKSMWVQREIEYFISKHGHEHVFVVLADGTMDESVPKHIVNVYGEDGVTVVRQAEPLAAMIVANTKLQRSKKLRMEKLRLIAGMLGCPYDSLFQREKRRRLQRYMTLIGVMLGFAVLFISMLLLKNDEIAEKNREIVAKNEQIHQQLQQTLLNESNATAQLALQQVAEGDRRAAIVSLLKALPSEENQRPYSAQAEYALATALGAYEPGIVYQDGTICQKTQIKEIEISTNGKYIVTRDESCVLRGFDAESKELLWERQMDVAYLDSLDVVSTEQLWALAPSVRDRMTTSHILRYSNTVPRSETWLDMATGDVLAQSDDRHFFSPDGTYTITAHEPPSGIRDYLPMLFTIQRTTDGVTIGEIEITFHLDRGNYHLFDLFCFISPDATQLTVLGLHSVTSSKQNEYGAITQWGRKLETVSVEIPTGEQHRTSQTYAGMSVDIEKCTYSDDNSLIAFILKSDDPQDEHFSIYTVKAINLNSGAECWTHEFRVQTSDGTSANYMPYVDVRFQPDNSALLFCHTYTDKRFVEYPSRYTCVRIEEDGTKKVSPESSYNTGYTGYLSASGTVDDNAFYTFNQETLIINLVDLSVSQTHADYWLQDASGYVTRMTEGVWIREKADASISIAFPENLDIPADYYSIRCSAETGGARSVLCLVDELRPFEVRITRYAENEHLRILTMADLISGREDMHNRFALKENTLDGLYADRTKDRLIVSNDFSYEFADNWFYRYGFWTVELDSLEVLEEQIVIRTGMGANIEGVSQDGNLIRMDNAIYRRGENKSVQLRNPCTQSYGIQDGTIPHPYMFTAKIDRVEKTITVSRNDLIAAGQFGTPEFEQMMRMRTEFPGYAIVEHHIKRNADKQSYGKLTYDVMEGFIESHETDEQKRAAVLKEYETIKKISKTQRAAYAFVKKWFLGKYGEEFKAFQMKQDAKKQAAANRTYDNDKED